MNTFPDVTYKNFPESPAQHPFLFTDKKRILQYRRMRSGRFPGPGPGHGRLLRGDRMIGTSGGLIEIHALLILKSFATHVLPARAVGLSRSFCDIVGMIQGGG